MKTTPSAAKPITRLDRIQSISGMLRLLIFIGLILEVYSILAICFGLPPLGNGNFSAAGHIYTSLAEVPQELKALMAVKVGFGFFGAWMLQSLLRLYQQGILFTARNVWYIRVLGYYVIIDWLINYQLEAATHAMELHLTQLFVGLLIIFVAWIMDEGRKIQEEQELTV